MTVISITTVHDNGVVEVERPYNLKLEGKLPLVEDNNEYHIERCFRVMPGRRLHVIERVVPLRK